MWTYEKRLQYPVKIKKPDARAAKIIISQFGGPDGELAASQRYLSQRYSMPLRDVAGVLTDIGTEELAHMEIVCAIIHQLTRDLTVEQIKTGWGYGTDMEMLALLPWMTELLSAPVLLAGVVYGILSIFFRHEKRLMVTNALLFALAAAQIGLTNLFLFC